MKELKTHIVEFENHNNEDGTLTDIKFYINEYIWSDGELDSLEVFDYITKTVAMIDNDEVVLNSDVDQVLLTKLKEMAIIEVLNDDSRYIFKDLGGCFE